MGGGASLINNFCTIDFHYFLHIIFGEEKYFLILFKWEDNGVTFSMLQSSDKMKISHITFARKCDYTTFIDMTIFFIFSARMCEIENILIDRAGCAPEEFLFILQFFYLVFNMVTLPSSFQHLT